MTEQFFEMLWDCPQCDTRALLGSVHRHCPACGTAQDPTRRYFPSPGQEVEAKNHRYVGVDWACAYCKTPNSAAAAFCGNCGGPKEASRPVAQVSDRSATPAPGAGPAGPATAAPPANQPPAGSAQRLASPGLPWFRILLLLLLVAGSVLAYLFASKHDEGVQIAAKSWSRSMDVERFTALRVSDWCDAMPADATVISRTREPRSTRQIPAGQDCTTVRSDMGDGTFTQRQECTPRYRSEPVFDNKCSYRINRWQRARTEQLTGDARQTPAWPVPALANSPGAGNTLGAERLGPRHEAYRVTLQSTQGKSWACEVDAATWSNLAEQQQLTLKVRGTGGADCSSLARPAVRPPGATPDQPAG